MATKPTTLPRAWCTNAVYLTGPFAGSAGKVDPGIGVAAEGHRPGAADPTAAEHENYQQNLVTASWIPWVNSGSSAGAADAHILEADATGRFGAVGAALTGDASGTTLSVTAGTNVNGIDVLGNGTASCISMSSSGSGPSLVVVNSGAGVAAEITSNSGLALDVTGSGAIAMTVNGGSTYCLFAQSDSNGHAGAFLGVDGGAAIFAVGGDTAGTNAMNISCDSVDGFAVSADTRGDATSAGRAGKFAGRGAAIGVEATATGNFALKVQGDTTNPTFGQVQFVATNNYPTNFGDGSVAYVSTGGAGVAPEFAMGSALDSAFRGFWTSMGGFVYGSNVTQLLAGVVGVYQTICTVGLAGHNAPKTAGNKVRITVTMRVGPVANVAETMDLRVRDTTAAVTVVSHVGAGFLATNGYYIQAAGFGNFNTTVAFDVEYTIPAAGPRTFILEFKSVGGGALTAQASMVVTGSY